MDPQQSPRNQALSALSSLPRAERFNLDPVVKTRTVDFARFRKSTEEHPEGIPPTMDELVSWDPEDALFHDAQILRGICELTTSTMIEMNREGPCLPPDTTEEQLELLTRPTTFCIVVEGVWNPETGEKWGNEERYRSVLGYLRVYRSLDDAPDGQHMEEQWADAIETIRTTGKEIWRGDRLFAKKGCRYIGNNSIVEVIFQNLDHEMAENAIMLGIALDGANYKLAPVWMEAPESLKRHGAENLGYTEVKTFSDSDGQLRIVTLKLICYPPVSDEAVLSLKRKREAMEQAEIWRRQRLGFTLTHVLPADDAPVLCISYDDGIAFAEAHPGTVIYDASFNAVEKAKKGRKALNAVPIDRNLDFIKSLEDGSLGAIYISGELDWLAKEGKGTAEENLRANLKLLVSKLRKDAPIIIRNAFARSAESFPVYLEFKNDPELLRLFEDYCERTDRVKARVLQQRRGYVRFECDHATADDFLLKEQWRNKKDWDRECVKVYPVLSSRVLRNMLQELGLRVEEEKAEDNFYKEDRWEGTFAIYGPDNERLAFPIANRVMTARKISEGEGAEIREIGRRTISAGPDTINDFLRVRAFRDRETGKTHTTVGVHGNPITRDYAFHFNQNGRRMIFVRENSPRPNTIAGNEPLGEAYESPYTTEQIAMFTGGGREAEQEAELKAFFELKDEELEGIKGATYLAGPLSDEVVEPVSVEIEPSFERRTLKKKGKCFSSPGTICAVDADKVTDASDVGGLQSERLARAAQALPGVSADSWLGLPVEMEVQEDPGVTITDFGELLDEVQKEVIGEGRFEEVDPPLSSFAEIAEIDYVEYGYKDGQKVELARETLQCAMPAKFSTNILLAVPVLRVARSDGGYEDLMGVEVRRDLPAVEYRLGLDGIVTPPTSYFGKEMPDDRVEEYGAERLNEIFNIECGIHQPFGGDFEISPGIMPCRIHAVLYMVDAKTAMESSLKWVRVPTMPEQQRAGKVRCGLLHTAINRAVRALGYSKSNTPAKEKTS